MSGFPGHASGKEPNLSMQETWETGLWSLRQEDPLEEGLATHKESETTEVT